MSEQRYQGRATCAEHGTFTFNTVSRKVRCPTCNKVVWRAGTDPAPPAAAHLFGGNLDRPDASRTSVHRSHRGEGFNHVD